MFLRCCLVGMLAALSAEVTASTCLTVTADSVELTGEATNDRVSVDVLNGNRLKIRSLNSQKLILGGVESQQHIIALVSSLEADLRGGADFLQLRDRRTNATAGASVFANGVIVNLGNGRNTVQLSAINLGGDFSYQGGSGRVDQQLLDSG